jgi:Protein of unknown function (DUF1194)
LGIEAAGRVERFSKGAMTAVRSILLAVLLAAGWLWPLAAVAEDVDLQLVLAVDVSRSIDDDEFNLQRQGYAQAFTHPSVIQAIQANPHGRIAVTFVEWAGADFQKVVVPWTVVSDPESGALFSEAIQREPRAFWGWTSISGAIDHSMRVLAASPHNSQRRVIDISADGVNNSGRNSADARDEAVAAGVTINGLVIMNDRPTPGFFQMPQPALDEFFRAQVIGGPGAFVIAIDDFSTFAYAIVNKLVKEIAGDLPTRSLAEGPR